MPAGQIEDLIRSKLANCGRVVSDREIKAGIKNSIDFAWTPRGALRPAHPDAPPQPDLQKIERLVTTGLRVADLWHSSPDWFVEPQTEAIIDRLFPGNPLLCCGKSPAIFDTKPRKEWLGALNQQSLLVPSPMIARSGLTQDGKESAHSLSNTGPRRFIVVEFDFSEFGRDGHTPTIYQPMLLRLKQHGITVHDICSDLLLRLNRIVPMTLAVNSGGKSIHGWWFCAGHPEEKLKKFHDYARTLGADPATWRTSQFVRMPDGTRDNGKPQPVLYFDPATIPP